MNAKKIGFLLGLLIFVILLIFPIPYLDEKAGKVVAVAAWMVVWWVFEAVSISVTALVPLAFFPLLGVMDIKAAASNYSSPIVFLFFGGFVMALALENVGLHKRIALNIMRVIGGSANKVILGFMTATALMSMWISNTASTVVMLPIALSVIDLLLNDADGYTKNDKNFALSILLGIAFAANVGGIATLIGTPPNSVMLGFLEKGYGIEIGFFDWMKLGVPFAIVLLFISFLCLVYVFYPNRLGKLEGSKKIIDDELAKLGKIGSGERVVILIFMMAIFCWIARGPLNTWFPSLQLTDTTISVLAALAMFTIPYRFQDRKFTIVWEDTRRLPWGILILFGGGLALASGFAQAGLIDTVGNFVAGQSGWTVWGTTVTLILLVLFCTELMSNVALTAVVLPLVAGIAMGFDVPVLQMVVPVTIASSCAFMLPMATPPNAIVFASGHVKVGQMAKIGFFLNLISVALISCLVYFFTVLT